MYNKVLSGILIVLLIAIIGTLGYLGYGYFTKYNNEKQAEKYLEEEFDALIVDLSQKQDEEVKPEQNGNNGNTSNSSGYRPSSTNNTNMSGYYRGFRVCR